MNGRLVGSKKRGWHFWLQGRFRKEFRSLFEFLVKILTTYKENKVYSFRSFNYLFNDGTNDGPGHSFHRIYWDQILKGTKMSFELQLQETELPNPKDETIQAVNLSVILPDKSSPTCWKRTPLSFAKNPAASTTRVLGKRSQSAYFNVGLFHSNLQMNFPTSLGDGIGSSVATSRHGFLAELCVVWGNVLMFCLIVWNVHN